MIPFIPLTSLCLHCNIFLQTPKTLPYPTTRLYLIVTLNQTLIYTPTTPFLKLFFRHLTTVKTETTEKQRTDTNLIPRDQSEIPVDSRDQSKNPKRLT